MKALFVSAGGAGHTMPMLPLAEAMVSAGHHVTFAAGSDSLPDAASRGFATAAAGPSLADRFDFRKQHGPPGHGGPTFAMDQMFTRFHAYQMVPDLLDVVDSYKPQLLIHDAAEFASPIVGSLRSIPWFQHAYGLLRFQDLQEVAAKAMSDLWVEHGLQPLPLAGMYEHGYIDICPPSLQLPHAKELTKRIPLGVPTPTGKIDNEASTVLVSFGTIFNAKPGLLGSMARAAAETGRDVLLTTGPRVEASTLGDLPANISVTDFVPLEDVLGNCAAVLTHGGSGTTLRSLAWGVPLVIVPLGADQFANADQVQAAGAGLQCSEDPGDVLAALNRVLSEESFALRARRIAEEIASTPTTDEVAAKLVAYAQSHK